MRPAVVPESVATRCKALLKAPVNIVQTYLAVFDSDLAHLSVGVGAVKNFAQSAARRGNLLADRQLLHRLIAEKAVFSRTENIFKDTVMKQQSLLIIVYNYLHGVPFRYLYGYTSLTWKM